MRALPRPHACKGACMARRRRALEYLEHALETGELVEFHRSVLDASTEAGFVVGMGKQWILFQVFDDRMRLDGYRAVRKRDVARTRPDPRTFHQRSLEITGQVREIPKGIELDRTRDVLRTGTDQFRIVSVHVEYTDPRICYIGIARMGKKYLRLLEIKPSARWRRKPTEFHLSNISRIDFGAGYERALLAVADAEAKPHSKRT